MTPTPHDKPIRRPRPVRYRVDASATDRAFHEIRIALTMLCEDEGKAVMDSLIRDACYDAAGLSELRMAERIMALAEGTKAQIGPVIACEIMDAISRLWEEYENGDGVSE